jgi:hypothetical protein
VEKIAPDLLSLVKEITFAREDPDNANTHPEENIEEIKRSLAAHGQVKPVVFWRGSGGVPIIKAGNGTLRAAKELGWTKLAMAEFLGTEAEAKAYALADNHASELSVWDVSKRDAQLKELGIVWKPMNVDWKPVTSSFGQAPPITIVPPREAPKTRERKESPSPQTPSKRVTYGDLWLLGRHKVMCASPTDEKSVRLLCSGERPSLRYVTVPPDTRPAWWGLGANLIPPETGFEPLIKAFQGELDKTRWPVAEVEEITRNYRAAHWFMSDGGWELIPRDSYEALLRAGEGKAFSHPYDAILAAFNRLQNVADKDASSFCEPFSEGDKEPILVLGSVLPGALVAAEEVGRKCFGALADPELCAQAISFFEERTGQQAEKA